MNKYLCGMIGLLLVAGCQSTMPPAARAPSQKEMNARARLEMLERQLNDRAQNESELSNRVDQIHADLLAAAIEMRDIKLRANDVTLVSESNRVAMAQLEAEIMEQRNVVLECEKEAAEEMRKVASLQDAMVREREAAKVARSTALEEEAQRAEAMQKALDREKELRERDQAIVQEREKQIESLRSALEERDKLLRAHAQTPSSSGSAAVAPAVAEAEPAEVADKASTAPESDKASEAFKLVAQGNAALRDNKLDDAEKAYQSALEISPELMDARVGLATCRYTRGELDEASRMIGQVLKDDPRNARALGLRGLLLWRKGDLETATDVLNKAVQQDSTDSQLENYLGIVLFERKKFQAAREALYRSVELDPDNGEAQFNLAVVLASGASPDLDGSRTHYQEAIRLGSERDDAMDQILFPK